MLNQGARNRQRPVAGSVKAITGYLNDAVDLTAGRSHSESFHFHAMCTSNYMNANSLASLGKSAERSPSHGVQSGLGLRKAHLSDVPHQMRKMRSSAMRYHGLWRDEVPPSTFRDRSPPRRSSNQTSPS